jgi:hypothetical protein
MTPAEAAKLVAMILQAYPAAQFGPASSQLYEAMLADVDVEMGKAAVHRLIATSRFLPTIAEIRTMAADLQHGPPRLGEQAWGDVIEAIRRVGHYRPAPNFADERVAESVRVLGWRNLCLSANDAADRARFITLYDGLSERHRADLIAGRALPPAAAHNALPVPFTVRALPLPKVAPRMTVVDLDAALEKDRVVSKRRAAS